MFDSDCRVVIPMSLETTITNVLTHRKRLPNPLSAIAAILRGVRGGNSDYPATSVLSFVFEYLRKSSPTGVTDTFGEMVILHHPFDVQIFNGNRVKLSNDIESGFMVKVQPLALNLLMLLRQQFDSLASAITSLIGSPRNLSVRRFEFSFGHAVVFWVLNYLTRAQRRKVLNAGINADVVAGLRKEAGLVLFNGEDDIPAIRLTLDRAGFDCLFNRTGETNARRADFGKMKLVAFKPETTLRIGEGIVSRRWLESRIARRFSLLHSTKEGIKGFVQAAQRLLKNLAVNIAHIFTDLFDLWKLHGLGVIVDRKPVETIGVAPFLERGVIEFAANIQRAATGGYESRVWPQLVFVRLQFLHLYEVIYLLLMRSRAKRYAGWASTRRSNPLAKQQWRGTSRMFIRQVTRPNLPAFVKAQAAFYC